MKRRITYAGAALAAVFATVVLTAPSASAETDWQIVGPDVTTAENWWSDAGPAGDEVDWG